MPNTPAAIGIGATGIAAGTAADDEAMGFARAIFEAVGIVAEVDEAQIADVAAVSGSGPAYVFYLIEQMVAAAIRIGMPEDQAHEFVVQTFRGAIGLVHANPDVEPSELRRRVTSPKGTTERAIQVLEAADLGVTFEQAMRSNVRRSEELAAGS
jgi:pyrroline-5-carboxylate reductase